MEKDKNWYDCRPTGSMPILQKILEFFGYKPKEL